MWSRRAAIAAIPPLLLAAIGAAQDFGPFCLISPAARARLATLDRSRRAAIQRGARRVVDRAPQPRARIRLEGRLPSDPAYADSQEAVRDFPAARDLALAAATGDTDDGVRATAILAAWLETYRPNFNPIDETGFENVFIAWDLLGAPNRGELDPSMQRFLRAMAEGYLAAMAGARGATAINNWQSHRAKLATLTAFGTGDSTLIDQTRRAFGQHLAVTLRADGPTIDFAERDALHYVVYNLQPLCTACLAAQEHGEDWFSQRSATGAALSTSLDWLAPYAEGRKTHAEFERSTVRFDFERRRAGVAGFSGNFEPAKARELYALAARLDPRYRPLAVKLASGTPWYDVVWPLQS